MDGLSSPLTFTSIIICRIQRDGGGAESVQRGVSVSPSLAAVASATTVLIQKQLFI
ncbi:hypothetical protein PULV_b0450 [Pseudoalteromonas ulvae UL12]|nr:hypothetical protein [Pseudoalteromonas ulvae UL12]